MNVLPMYTCWTGERQIQIFNCKLADNFIGKQLLPLLLKK